MNILALVGLSPVLLFIISIASKRKKQISDFLLMLFLFLLGLELVYRFTDISMIGLDNRWIIGSDLIYWALLGPTLFLYVDFIIYRNRKFVYTYFLHLIPLFLILIPFIAYLLFGNPANKFFWFVNHSNWFNRVVVFLWEYITPVYYIVILIRLYRFRKMIRNYFSSIRKRDLKWLVYLTSGFLLYFMISLTLLYLRDYEIIRFFSYDDQVCIAVLVIYVFGIGIFGIRQEGIFTEYRVLELSNQHLSMPFLHRKEMDKKYTKSGLSHAERKEILEKLERILEQEKIYRDCELTLNDLAQKIHTTNHKLSQVINEIHQQNFYEFINGFRVEEIKQRLEDPKNEHFKIMSLAYDSGFNSKSAFYTAFKKVVGITPTEYRNQLYKEQQKIFSN